ncbi:MAG TPA: Dabb family protein [Iamia sp.]|nr:Dabb family protein [Iamia sp.]
MLTHIVLITASDDATDEQVDAMVAGLRALPGRIEEIRSYEVGRDLGLAEGNATVAIQATFASPEDLEAYVVHPAHQEVLTGLIRPIAASVARAQVPA